MAHYLDTGSNKPEDTAGFWLDSHIKTNLTGFRGQFGYFTYSALSSYAPVLQALLTSACPVHLVLGSNEGTLQEADLSATFSLMKNMASGHLTVVSFSNALFHPKTYHLTRSDGSALALVGSSNFTESGLGINVEANLSLDTQDGDDNALLQSIALATERWSQSTEKGVFQIQSENDIGALVRDKVINIPVIHSPRPGASGQKSSTELGSRTRLWKPAISAPQRVRSQSTPVGSIVRPSKTRLQSLRWSKQLQSSDAQQVSAGSNPTGKLRLTESRQNIDHKVFFRNDLFGYLSWATQLRGGNPLEIATATFNVTVRGIPLGSKTLMIDHAPHRVAGQGNVPTVLSWGRDLGRLLSQTSHIGDWVILERDGNGNLSLTIQSSPP